MAKKKPTQSELADSLGRWVAKTTKTLNLSDDWIAGARAVVTELRQRGKKNTWLPEKENEDG